MRALLAKQGFVSGCCVTCRAQVPVDDQDYHMCAPAGQHWTPSQWAAIERHARAERICAEAARKTAGTPTIASHWHRERWVHAATVRAYVRAALPDLQPVTLRSPLQ